MNVVSRCFSVIWKGVCISGSVVIMLINLMLIVSGKFIENMLICGVMWEIMFSMMLMNNSIVIKGNVIYRLMLKIFVF